jgi:hypothetical protein
MMRAALVSVLHSKHERIEPRRGCARRGVLAKPGCPAVGVWLPAGVFCANWSAALVVVILRIGMTS